MVTQARFQHGVTFGVEAGCASGRDGAQDTEVRCACPVLKYFVMALSVVGVALVLCLLVKGRRGCQVNRIQSYRRNAPQTKHRPQV